MKRRITTKLLSVLLVVPLLTACGDVRTENSSALTYDEASEELASLLTKVDAEKVEEPAMDIYSDEVSEADALADIDTFELVVKGDGDINIEVAAATELSSDAPDDWISVMAEKFNRERYEVNGKTVSVSVRRITSGETFTYMTADAYAPNVYIPSNYAWGKMLEASGIAVTEVTDCLVGNTAGFLMKQKSYDKFMETYKEATVENIITAALEGDITLAYTNPYTSSAGLNILGAILHSFDSSNPLSDTAVEKLKEYQKTSPPVAYTTAVLENQAAKGIIDTMVMEEQAYINTQTLSGYVYIPAGIRHDHPVYTFSYNTEEQNEAARLFTDYCKTDEAQTLASDRGFNLHGDYKSDDPGLSGSGWLSAQSIWKENKTGGNPVAAVFVCDVSGSMDGLPLNSLKDALTSASAYIGSGNYIGLVSYNDTVTVNLPVAEFDASQRAYFSGEVKNLSASGGTATYDAVLTALDMLQDVKEEVPDVKPMLFVLSDGETNTGYSLSRVSGIVDGLDIPIYTIGYNYNDSSLAELSEINEAANISAESEDVVNQLRNLFNANL